MRRALFACGILALVGCGISAVASQDGPDTDTPDAAPTANLPDTMPPPGPDGGIPIGDGGLIGDDSGPVFAHIAATDFTFPTAATTIAHRTTIDTGLLTVDLGDGTPLQPLTRAAGDPDHIAVWSVGPLTINDDVTIFGLRALVIFVNGDATLGHTITAAADQTDPNDAGRPGPGGRTAQVGAGAGGAGQTNSHTAGGGGGAGHGTPGAKGGQSGVPGSAGTVENVAGTLLVGGAGGGNGGGFVGGGLCARGGNGGGALQISALGKIVFSPGTLIDLSGGGGMGGCSTNGVANVDPSAGGGGGAGGLLYLEAKAGIVMPFGTSILASGGAGGEGGDYKNSDGNPGETATFDSKDKLAIGGNSGTKNGGNGGNGGVGGFFETAAIAPMAGDVNADAGGGGGAGDGVVFFRVHAPAVFDGGGAVIAESKTETF